MVHCGIYGWNIPAYCTLRQYDSDLVNFDYDSALDFQRDSVFGTRYRPGTLDRFSGMVHTWYANITG